MKTQAYGLIDPDGELAPFTGYDEEFAWGVLARVLGYDLDEFKAKLEGIGWRIVPVEVSTIGEDQ
jgi:hypothetical protein